MAHNPMLEATKSLSETPHFTTVVEALRQSGPVASFRTALRTRSPLALRALTQLATADLTLDELVELARDPGRADEVSVDPEYTAALAGVLYADARYEDSQTLYRLAASRAGGMVPGEHQNWYLRGALRVGADILPMLEQCTALSPVERAGLAADAAHPSNGGDEERWLAAFSDLTGMRGLKLTGDESLPWFDRLSAEPGAPVTSDVKISIIMTCYRPGPETQTAIRSVVAQTWQNWELLLVDDCSGEAFHSELAALCDLDPRIKLLPLPRNGGTYAARNRALFECTGQFTTGMDADDWVHPDWLERQARPLLKDAKAVMTISGAIRAHSDLSVTRSNRPIRGPRSTSIMFRTSPVRERMGYFDAVRKGADTEFRMRFGAVFGNRAVRRLTDVPLSIVRLGDDTLTSSEFGLHWLHPGRHAYQSAQRHWHGRIRSGQADPYLPAGTPRRPFFAPESSWGRTLDGRSFDRVFIADARLADTVTDSVVEQMTEAARAGERVALLHVESLHHPASESVYHHAAILDAMHEDGIALLSPADDVETDRLVVTDPALWQGRESEFSLRSRDEPVMWEPTSRPELPLAVAQSAGSKPAAPARTSAAVRRRPVESRLKARRGPLAAVAVLVAVLAAATWPVAGPTAGAVALFACAAVVLLIPLALSTARGYRLLMNVIDRRSSL